MNWQALLVVGNGCIIGTYKSSHNTIANTRLHFVFMPLLPHSTSIVAIRNDCCLGRFDLFVRLSFCHPYHFSIFFELWYFL